MRLSRLPPRVMIFTMLFAMPALADAIDGDWCSPEGRKSISIEGPKVRTPGGATITGSYGRHDFSFVAPAGDPSPGTRVDMRLMGEQSVRVTEGDAAPAIWRRCPPGIS
ncbi:MAG: hypothetical protein ACRCXM_16265 [Beijerinckiaceae bacterium]